ncbi:DUF2628 domain-containing protein [Afifella pfennigii]|uniref:DUF2628 domain-containing protein n=1 Tax=Afifella pfennigii TaxID=209897 RepID=UPI00047A840C|nr:DUF2628 domain-containing protein [Afifella pfennigii]
MRHYTVHLPAELAERPFAEAAVERAVFVKDGFNWPALFIPLIWLLFRRMWLALLLYLAASAAIAGIGAFAGETAATWSGIAFAILFALEANNLRRWTLERRGYREVGSASGAGEEEAALRFFSDGGLAGSYRPAVGEATLDRAPASVPRFSPRRASGRADGEEPAVMGLFPERGG